MAGVFSFFFGVIFGVMLGYFLRMYHETQIQKKQWNQSMGRWPGEEKNARIE